MSFGFSVGDFVAAAKLTSDIISSLQTIDGAKSEYQELIRELQSLQTALRYLDQLDDTKASSKHVQPIRCAALACRYPLESFLTKIKKYEASLGPWGRSNAAKTAKNKLLWTFGEKDEISRLRAYLSMHIDTINNMLLQHGLERMDLLGKEAGETASHIQSQLDAATTALGDIQKSSAGQAVIVRTMHTMLGTLCQTVCGEITTTLQQLSQVVTTVCASTQQMYTVVLEIRDSVNSVDTRFTYFQAPYQVEDAKGFVFPVPSEYSLDELENIIAHKFRAGPGARDVRTGNYELCNTKRRSERVTETTGLRPGMAITMAIIITTSATSDTDSVCPMPHCESSNIAVNLGGGFRCRDCDVWFGKANKKRRRIDEVDDPRLNVWVTNESESGLNVTLAAPKSIPANARWTRIDRRLVNPEALEEAKERFEERIDCVIVLRVLTKQEIQQLANRTKEIRVQREKKSEDRKRSVRDKTGHSSPRNDREGRPEEGSKQSNASEHDMSQIEPSTVVTYAPSNPEQDYTDEEIFDPNLFKKRSTGTA